MLRLDLPVLAFTLFLLTSLAGAPLAAEAPAVDGHWEGAIEIPGTPLEIDIDFETAEDGTLSGDISIPIQQLEDFDLSDVAREGDAVRFKIPGIPGEPAFEGTLADDGTTIAGTFTQGGGSLDFELTRGDDKAAQARAALEDAGPLIDQLIKDWNVPGTAIAVVAGGEVVFAEGFGYRDVEQKLPMTANSLFAIGSTTKAFTATLLGMLVDEGTLDWDQPVRRYLAGFELQDPMATLQITPRDLVTHRSGLPRHDLLWYNNTTDTRASLIARFPHLEPTAGLREKWQYNNLMFMTAGYLGGQLTGGTWEEAVRARILDPLGMTRSTLSVLDSQEDDDHALPYREDDDSDSTDDPKALERIPFRNIDIAGPAGSINSSVAEMSKWLLFNLNGGRAGDQQLINASTLADIHAPHAAIPTAPDRPDISQSSYGMGWSIDTYRGHRRVAHGGGIDGFVTSVMMFPDDQVGIVTFTNRGSGLPPLLAQHAADRVLGLGSINWAGEALAQQKQAEAASEETKDEEEAIRVADTQPSHPLGDYAGTYEDAGYGTLLIDHADGQLSMTYNGIHAPLEHWHYEVWNALEDEDDPAFEGQKLLFRHDLDGNVAAVEARFEVQTGPIVFDKAPPAQLTDPTYLAQLTGRYSLNGQIADIALSGTTLTVHLPGQPTYTLMPQVSGRFMLKEVSIVTLNFDRGDSGEVTGITFYQPNGVFKATRVE